MENVNPVLLTGSPDAGENTKAVPGAKSPVPAEGKKAGKKQVSNRVRARIKSGDPVNTAAAGVWVAQIDEDMRARVAVVCRTNPDAVWSEDRLIELAVKCAALAEVTVGALTLIGSTSVGVDHDADMRLVLALSRVPTATMNEVVRVMSALRGDDLELSGSGDEAVLGALRMIRELGEDGHELVNRLTRFNR